MLNLIEYIDEGLIWTYDPYRVIDTIIKEFQLKKSEIDFLNSIDEYDRIDYENNDQYQEEVIGIEYTKKFQDKQNKKNLDDCLDKLGWYLATKNPIKNKNRNKIFLVYYPKFQCKINDKVHEKYKYLYHYTEKSKKDKVLKYGLVPKESKENARFIYRNRVHLLNTKIDDVKDEKEKEELLDTFDGYNELIEIKIDISKFNSNFYIDPNCRKYGYIVYDNIPPKYIDSIKDYR